MKQKHGLILSALIVLCAMCLAIPTQAAQGGLHWYCIRTKGHRQPPIPSEFAFVEECDGYFLDRNHGDGDEDKVVYLTFDAGYENGNVAKTLDILNETNTPGAFFILKHLVDAEGELVKKMTESGHLVCNHTAHHPNLSNASPARIREELESLSDAYLALTGKEMAKYFRPPEGAFSRELLQNVQSLGYRTVFWSFAYADWDNNRQPPPQKAMQCVMDNVHNGAVILLHPTSATNVEILPRVIAELKAEGYRFGTLDELCGVS